MGIIFMMGIFYWINILENFTLIDFIFLGIYQGIYFGLFGLGFGLITRKTRFPAFLAAPCLWVAMEYLRSFGDFAALPWAFLGYSQYLNLTIIQISAVTGVYGVSFLIVTVNVILSEIVVCYANRRPPVKDHCIGAPAIIGAGVVGLSLLYGLLLMKNMASSQRMSVAVIQANIAQAVRWQPSFREQNFEKHAQLTKEAAKSTRVSLIVWPETAVQGSMSQNKDELAKFSNLARAIGAYLLVGSAERPKFRSNEARTGATAFNTAFLIAPSGEIAGRYDKIRLLPFGEYLPLKQFPWPSRIASSWSAGEFRPGTRYTVFNLEDTQFAVTICWENIFPDLFRRFVKNGAKLMINITNEAWFGETAAPYQLMAMSVFRAVENHVSIARAANTGISVFIDPVGRILSKVKRGDKDIFVEGYRVENVSVSSTNTFYTKYGDVFAELCTAASLLLVLLPLVRSKA